MKADIQKLTDILAIDADVIQMNGKVSISKTLDVEENTILVTDGEPEILTLY